MYSGVLPTQTTYRPALNNVFGPRVGRQQPIAPVTSRRTQRTGVSIISNVATAPLPPPADFSRPALPPQVSTLLTL